MTSDAATLPAGQTFGRYVVVRALGSGAFGAVYEAVQQPLGKRVALKVLHAAQVHDAEAVRRFQAEAEATARLRHPHIVDVVDLGDHEGRPFIAMEFLEGETLSSRVEREARLPARAAVDLLVPVLSAVASVHDAGIVHRDLKPDNIFLATVRPGKVSPKLLDFGIAKVRDAQHSLTRTGSMMGTVHYMSPEQARESKDVDGRSDQWALAVILYECLTGRMAFPGEALIEVLTGIIGATAAPMTDAPGLPEGLEAVVLRALQKNRDDRYGSVRALGAALLPFASPAVRDEWSAEFDGHLEAAAPPPPRLVAPSPLLESVSVSPREIPAPAVDDPVTPAPRPSRRVFAASAAALAVVATAIAGYQIGRDRTPPQAPRTVVRMPEAPVVVAQTPPPVDAQVAVDAAAVARPVAAAVSARVAAPPAVRRPRPRAGSNGVTLTGIEIH